MIDHTCRLIEPISNEIVLTRNEHFCLLIIIHIKLKRMFKVSIFEATTRQNIQAKYREKTKIQLEQHGNLCKPFCRAFLKWITVSQFCFTLTLPYIQRSFKVIIRYMLYLYLLKPKTACTLRFDEEKGKQICH